LETLSKNGTEAEYVQADVSNAADRQRLVDTVEKRFGRLDVLVNNAGIAPRVRADILEASEESFDEQISINLKGPYFLTQTVAKWMIRQKRADCSYRGCIINISSCSATVASVSRGDYCISKAGIAMATKLWVVRLAEFGIDVYEIRPGIIETNMTKEVKGKYDVLIEGDLLLQKRWGTPSDIGKAAAMLARGDLPYASGSVLSLDGGLTISRL
jgi:NAD(P)-dependent dehydrogenase (short-subunit alcohol dehydrogenase family)